MNKLIKELESIDFENVSVTNKTLRGLHGDILFFAKAGNKKLLAEIRQLITNFISINSKELYKSYRKSRFISELDGLAKLVSIILEK